MDVVILTKRGISFQHIKRGEQTVLYVPSQENIKIYKDITNTDTIAERYGGSGVAPLWRQLEGQIIVYGSLPETLGQRRQPLKVWLAEDFAPATATSFYYVFGEKWIVHGLRETDDEGRRDWRVTLLKAPDEVAPGAKRGRNNESTIKPAVQLVIDSISEHMLENAEDRPCVAVYEDLALYEQFQVALKPLSLQPVPFSTLSPAPRLKPLYKQSDFTLLMVLGILIAILILAASCAFWFVHILQVRKLDDQIDAIRKQITDVQINASLGHIGQPEQILQTMQKAFEQRPSAIVDATARFGNEFGKLNKVVFSVGSADSMSGTPPANSLPKGEQLVRVTTSDATNQLLVDQEKLANILIAKAPWIRRVENMPVGSGLTLDIVLQTENPDGTPLTLQPAASYVEESETNDIEHPNGLLPPPADPTELAPLTPPQPEAVQPPQAGGAQ